MIKEIRNLIILDFYRINQFKYFYSIIEFSFFNNCLVATFENLNFGKLINFIKS
jgi:hypothetical protein